MRLNKKPEPTVLTPRLIAVSLVFLSIFIVEFFSKTWCGVQCIQTGYDITRELDIKQRLINRQKNLTIELVHLKSPQVLTKLAKERFELAIPRPEQVIIIP